jgi:hypothetical protein
VHLDLCRKTDVAALAITYRRLVTTLDHAPAPNRRLDLHALVPPRLDAAIAVVFLGLSLAEVMVNGTVESPWKHIVFGGGAMASLAWRRRFPVLVPFLVASSNLFVNPEGEFTVLLSLVLVSFTAGAEAEPPRSYLGLAAVTIPFFAGIANAGRLVPSDVAAAVVFLVGPWVVGSAMRQRSASTLEALSRAERLEREQAEQAAAAVAAERTRIARELHDIVSHSISVVTIQTQAVRRRLGPEHAAEAADLAAVEATAREALAEMRRLFGVLRADGESASLTPQPGLANFYQRTVGRHRPHDHCKVCRGDQIAAHRFYRRFTLLELLRARAQTDRARCFDHHWPGRRYGVYLHPKSNRGDSRGRTSARQECR